MGKWAPVSGRLEYLVWSWGEFYVVLGCMQRVKDSDTVMSYITLFHSNRGYYCGNIRILWIYPRSVDIIRISWIYLHSVDIIHILWKCPCSMYIIPILWMYPYYVDTLGIIHMSYLARNFHHVLHGLFLVVDIIFCHITSYLAHNVHHISHIIFI